MSARSDLISGVIVLVVTAIFYAASLEIEEDPFGTGMQPYELPQAVCMMIAGLTTLFVLHAAWRVRGEAKPEEASGSFKLFVVWVMPMAGIAFAYIGLMQLFQYLLPTAIALTATLALFGNRGIAWLVAVPVATSCAYYAVFFGLFRLLEPRGLWLEYDNYYLFGPIRAFLGMQG